MAFFAFVHLAALAGMQVLTDIFLAFVLIGSLNVVSENCRACSKVVDILEANLRVDCIRLKPAQGIVHACGGLAALMAGNTKIGVVCNKIAISILAAKGNCLAAWEYNTLNFMPCEGGHFFMAGCTHIAITRGHIGKARNSRGSRSCYNRCAAILKIRGQTLGSMAFHTGKRHNIIG